MTYRHWLPQVKRCSWCRRVIWLRSRNGMHLRCAWLVDRIYWQDQRITGT